MDHTKIYMITGANRGIGLGFTRHYLQQGHRIIATHRNDSKELMALQTEFPSHLILITMDVLLAASIQQAFTNITSAVTHIDVLINNAGRYGSDQATITEKLDIEDMVTTFRTNSLAPLLITQYALPLLQKGSDKKVIHISSKMGSITDNTSGGAYGYRASKSALNAINKSLSVELAKENITSIVMHPGWVQTDMGGKNAAITTDEAIQDLTQTIDRFTIEHTGGFFERTGETIPW